MPSGERSKVVDGSIVGERPEDEAVGFMPAWERRVFMWRGVEGE